MLKYADELKLNIDSTLQELPLWEVEVDLNCFGSDLMKPFKDEPLLPGVMITDNRRYVGMISRRKLFEYISRPFTSELFYNRPIAMSLKILQIEEGFVIYETTSIMEATYLSLQRSPELVYEPIIVKAASEKNRLLDFHQLLLAYSQIHVITLANSAQTQEQTKIPDKDFHELQHLQIQLLHQEKTKALRQIVSSIANEINVDVSVLKAVHQLVGDWKANQ